MAITYCIVCNITDEKYYGSTIRTLQRRMTFHKNKSNTCCSKQIIERGDYDIFQLGEYDSIEEAETKEKWYIDNKECINERRVRLTEEEKKEYNKKKQKKYRENNREKINEMHKKYREKNKDKMDKMYKRKYKKNNEKVNCEFCKKQLNRSSLTNHKKSFHLDAVLADKNRY